MAEDKFLRALLPSKDCKMKIVRGVFGGERKNPASICLVTGKVISQRQDFVLAMLVGFRDLDRCLVVIDI